MAYKPYDWAINDIITEERLDNIENGLALVSTIVDQHSLEIEELLLPGENIDEKKKEAIAAIEAEKQKALSEINECIDLINGKIEEVQQLVGQAQNVKNSVEGIQAEIEGTKTIVEQAKNAAESASSQANESAQKAAEEVTKQIDNLKFVKDSTFTKAEGEIGEMSFNFIGFISNSQKGLYFTIPLGRAITPDLNFEIDRLKITIRGQNGYIHYDGNGEYVIKNGTPVPGLNVECFIVNPESGLISIHLVWDDNTWKTHGTTTAVPNNRPCSVDIRDIYLRFVK